MNQMKKDAPRLKPAVRHSEVFKRLRSYWLGKTRRVEVNDNEKKPRIVKNKDQEEKKPDVKTDEKKEAPVTKKKEEASEKKQEPTTPQKGSEGVYLEPRKNVCMEECKIKVERKGKEVECGRL